MSDDKNVPDNVEVQQYPTRKATATMGVVRPDVYMLMTAGEVLESFIFYLCCDRSFAIASYWIRIFAEYFFCPKKFVYTFLKKVVKNFFSLFMIFQIILPFFFK